MDFHSSVRSSENVFRISIIIKRLYFQRVPPLKFPQNEGALRSRCLLLFFTKTKVTNICFIGLLHFWDFSKGPPFEISQKWRSPTKQMCVTFFTKENNKHLLHRAPSFLTFFKGSPLWNLPKMKEPYEANVCYFFFKILMLLQTGIAGPRKEERERE